MRYKVYRPNGLVYETNNMFKLLCYSIFIRRNPDLTNSIINCDTRASKHEFHIGNGIKDMTEINVIK